MFITYIRNSLTTCLGQNGPSAGNTEYQKRPHDGPFWPKHVVSKFLIHITNT